VRAEEMGQSEQEPELDDSKEPGRRSSIEAPPNVDFLEKLSVEDVNEIEQLEALVDKTDKIIQKLVEDANLLLVILHFQTICDDSC
jgi:hypothetical protein